LNKHVKGKSIVTKNKVLSMIILVLIFVLAACGGGEATTEVLPANETAANEEAAAQPDNSEVVEAEVVENETAVVLSEEVRVDAGGYAFQAPKELEVSVSDLFAEIADPNDADTQINIFGFPFVAGMGLTEMYDNFTTEFGSDETIALGEREDITVNGMDGFSAAISGEEDGKSLKGKIVVFGNEAQGVFVLAGAEESKWDGSVAEQTDTVINSISLFDIVMPELMEEVEEPTAEEAEAAEETDEAAIEEESAVEETESDPASDFYTVFPVPSDAANIIGEGGEGDLNFQTEMTLEEALEFYREELTAQGLAERDILTVVDETIFSIVFDGNENGLATVVQGVDLGEAVNINIRFEDS
jgi:hypothetical protein